jgi:hypothetical protein
MLSSQLTELNKFILKKFKAVSVPIQGITYPPERISKKYFYVKVKIDKNWHQLTDSWQNGIPHWLILYNIIWCSDN